MIEIEELEWAFKKLDKIGITLKMISASLLTLSLFHGGLIISVITQLLYLGRREVTLLSMMMLVLIFFFSLWFDTLRKDGKSYYDEISGAMHGIDIEEEKHQEFKSDSIKARVSIRKFMNSYDIPLIPGKYGASILLLFNIFLLILSVMLINKNY